MESEHDRRSANYDNPAIDRYAVSHLNAQTFELDKHLDEALRNCQKNGLPHWAVIASQGKFLMLQCRMLGVRHMLEIGTLGGHSAIWCTAANPDIKITTIEIQPKYAAVARENLRAAGVAERVEVIVGNAQDILPQLASEIDSGRRERFALVSVDVESFGEAWDLVDRSVGLCLNQACIVTHCSVRPSNLAIPTADEENSRVRGSRELIEKIGKDARLDAVLLMTEGEERYDMLVAAVRKM
jgi:predicted O-methyltransferase YrrM